MRFILLDEILEMEPGRRVQARRFISPDDDYFRDHFPGFPVVPGVLLTAGKCLDAEDPARGKSMLARINKANFRGWVRPGASAMIFGEVRTSRPQFATAECRVEVDKVEVCSAELMFSFVVMEQFSPGYRDVVLDRFLAQQKTGAAGTTGGTP